MSFGFLTKSINQSPPLPPEVNITKSMKGTIQKGTDYHRVWIKWLDSTMRKKVWWSPIDILDDVKKCEDGDYFYSTGYLFKETKKHYYLANSLHFEDKEVVSFGQIFSIPKGCVIQIKKA